MVRTNNNFLFSGPKKSSRLQGFDNVRTGVDSILKNELSKKSRPRKRQESWSKSRIISTILSTYREYQKRKNIGENVVFNTSFFLKYGGSDAKYLVKKDLSVLAYRFFGDEVDNNKELANLDLEGLMKLVLPIGIERDEILNTFEKGWSQKRIIKAIKDVHGEYLEKKKSGENVIFNTSFFANSNIKDGVNLTKKLKEFSTKALGKNPPDLRNLIELALPEGEEKDLILNDFKKWLRRS